METVTSVDFKRHLARYMALAHRGERIVVTRHNRPYATVAGGEEAMTHTGDRFGKTDIRPLGKNIAKGKGLAILLEDRHGGPDR